MDTRRIATGTILLLVAALFLLFYSVRLIMLVLAIGVGTGALLIPVVDRLRKKANVPASITAFLIIIGLVAVIGGIGYILYYIGSEQLSKVIDTVPSAYEAVRGWFSRHAGLPINRNGGVSIPSAAGSLLGTVLQGAKLGFELAAGLFFVVSVALYVAVDPVRNQNAFLTLFPAHLRPRVTQLMHESASTLRQWFVSHLIVVVCVGAAFALGLWILGNPYWGLIGILAAFLEFVPYIGPFTVAVLASAVAITNGHPMQVVWIVLLDLVIQELEGHVLLPLVMKERIDLPPVQLIALAIVMGIWFGILGVFATPPLLAVLKNVYMATYVQWMDQRTGPIVETGAPVRKAG